MMYYASSKAIPEWPLWTSGVNHPSFCPIKISGTSLKQFSSWAHTLFGFQGVNGNICKDQGRSLSSSVHSHPDKEAFQEDLLSLSRWERYIHFWNGIFLKIISIFCSPLIFLAITSLGSDNSLVSNSAVTCTLTLTWENQWVAKEIFQLNQMSVLKCYIVVTPITQPSRQVSVVAGKQGPAHFLWPNRVT